MNHVYNKDLHMLFEDKVSHKGYAWERCKSEKVKNRMEQLYRPLFQVSTMPKDGYTFKEAIARLKTTKEMKMKQGEMLKSLGRRPKFMTLSMIIGS